MPVTKDIKKKKDKKAGNKVVKVPKVAVTREGDKKDPAGFKLRGALPIVTRCSDAITKVLTEQGVKVDHDVVLNKLIELINTLGNPTSAEDDGENTVTASTDKNKYNLALDLLGFAYTEKVSGNQASFYEYANLAFETEGIEEAIAAMMAYNDDAEVVDDMAEGEIENTDQNEVEIVPPEDSLVNGEIDNVDQEDGLGLLDDSDLADDESDLDSETIASLNELLSADDDSEEEDDDSETTAYDESDEDSDDEEDDDDDFSEETASDEDTDNSEAKPLVEAPASAEKLAGEVSASVKRLQDRRKITAANRLSLSGTARSRELARRVISALK